MGERRSLWTTYGIGALAGAAACAALTTGVLGGGSRWVGHTVGLLALPASAAEGLPAFTGCEQLRQWYVDRALPQVGAWGFGGGPVLPMATERNAADGVPAGAPGVSGAVGSSPTGTTTQEAAVDESDIAKTDGRLVVRVSGRELVVTDVSTGRARELSRTTLPGPVLTQPELLLRDDRVVVVGDETGAPPYRTDAGRVFVPYRPQDSRTHLLSLDLSDPSAPRVRDDRTIDGGTVSMREYADGTVRVVVTTGYPPLDFVQPNRDRTPQQATRENRRIVRAAPIRAWLPGVRTPGSAPTPLLGCADVRHPLRASGSGTISVLTFPFDRPDRLAATAVAAAGDLVYSSSDRLYVATSAAGPVAMPLGIVQHEAVSTSPTTVVHSFALDGPRTTYVASGSVAGTVRDRWSFSAYDGHLRVAVQQYARRGTVDNAVVVLAERGGRLVRTGRVGGLGRGESIEAVRWFGDLAVVVTFRQTDPLYTLDLGDPAHPRVVGTLRIPGYSAYLHPVGGGLVVGVGHDATAAGSDLGAQAATFDLADPRHVRRLSTLGFGPQTDVSVALDPRTLTYLPEQRTLVTPVQDWASDRSRFVALHVAPDGTLTRTGSWVTRRYAGDAVRTLPLGGGRVALVGDVVRVVDVR